MEFSKQIDIVKKAFSLNNDEVFKILGISRKSLHTLENNEFYFCNILTDNSRRKIFDLYMLAKNWLELGYPTDRDSIFLKECNHETVFLLLSKFGENFSKNNKDKILFVGRYLLRNLDSNNMII